MQWRGEMPLCAHQTETVAGGGNSHSRRAGEPAHRLVAEQNVAEEPLNGLIGCAADEAREQ
jgi:hypothetical protein